MDKLAAMRTFVAIVDNGSLSAAAAALDRAPPTIVRSLSMLERALGTRLLNRTTRRLALTADGREYYARCRRILDDIEEAEASLSPGQTAIEGDVRLTAPVMFGQRHVTPPALAFAQRYPGLRLDLLLLDRPVNLLEEGIDLALRIGVPPNATTAVSSFGHMRQVVVASPSLLEAVGPPSSPRQLAQLPCVLFRGLAPGAEWRFAEGSRSPTVAVNGRIRCNQAAGAVTACVAGLGFGRFLAYQVEREVRHGELAVVLEDYEPPPLPVSLLFPHASLIATRVRLLADHLRDTLRADLAALALAAA